MVTIPKKLKEGDTIAVIAPANSLAIISDANRKIAIGALKSLGLNVKFSPHADEINEFESSSVKSRVEDLEWAFSDAKIKGVLPAIGGFNSNEMLDHINFGVIKRNPKPICGFSDITALQDSIFARTGIVTYSGPTFSAFAMEKGNEYTIDYFRKCLMSNEPYEILPSKEWSDDHWYRDQENRKFLRNEGPKIINEGSAKGTIIGGNLCTLNLLQGTKYMPSLEGSILFLEDDSESKPATFIRDFQSLMHQPGFDEVKGIVIGRFQVESEFPDNLIRKMITDRPELNDIPVIFNADFGHTSPMATFPIGGTAELKADGDNASIKIVEH
ncbi:MAG: LD-carboxypeptidase [Candidatus Marsarchaeota archaeon]|nr:LD-carboxypeptidase [Candidatus Marsarchaeota archaeon]